MISKETNAQIRRYFYAEHWKIGTIAHQLGVHPDTVRKAIEAERFHSTQPLRSSIVDPYVPFLRQTPGTISRFARYAPLPDDSRSRLQRQRRAVAAQRGPL